MKAYQSDLLLLLSKALFGREIRLSDPDWMQILKEARNQTVVQLAYSAVDQSALSPEEAKCWKQAAAIDIANSIKVGDDHSQLNEWMEKAEHEETESQNCGTLVIWGKRYQQNLTN